MARKYFTIATGLFIVLLSACHSDTTNTALKHGSVELINGPNQDTVFNKLVRLNHVAIPAEAQHDSLAFLILPVQASCPACRKKTIDSIVMRQTDLMDDHFIIISAKGGRKTINSYFREVNKELPNLPGRLFLDTTNQAYQYDLYKDKPTIYYTYNKKAYKKVAAIPATVREDLREFFSGSRSVTQ